MKPIILCILFFICISTSAQTVSGFYSGTLYNDTTKLIQQYELAISEYRGKITGYSYVTFVSNDTFYYGIRKVTGHIEDNKLIVRDDKFIANNFPEAPAKGVKRMFVIPLDGSDTLRNISGNWQTNRTKKFYSIPGTVTAARSNDSSGSALFAHLKEMEMMPQYAEDLKQPAGPSDEDLAKNQKKLEKEEEDRNKALAKAGKKELEKASKDAEEKARIEKAAEEERLKAVAKAEKQALDKARKDAEEKARIEKATEEEKQKAIAKAEKEALEKIRQLEKDRAREEKRKTEEAKAVALKNEEKMAAKTAVAVVTSLPFHQREKRVMKPIEITSDSLVLTFYDNGVVDGDSISVYANGVNIVSNMKLAATANRKKIGINNNEELEILLVAENMGSIPPNTGLLMIKDGDQTYQLHFTADLKTNAAIIIKRKKK
jgi:hypothetical protein